MLEIRGLSKEYDGARAIDGIDLAIPPGQMVAIVGRSGAGKSTFLRLINRLIEPSGGTVAFEGTDITKLKGASLRAWRSRCAMIFQQFNLIGRLDAITNVLMGRLNHHATLPSLLKRFPAAERALAVAALERLDIAQTALQRVDTLSGGQQQRVAIARALMQEPSLLLADEPIASLDPRNAKTVMDALKAINREDGITVLCNLHSLDIARAYCERIVGMAKGRIVFDDVPSRLDAAAAQAIYGAARDPALAEEAIGEELAGAALASVPS
jgi:phosphonate transport system ATP-binding protein